MKKNVIKLVLDLVMIVLLALLYNSHVFALIFHEITGITLGCLAIIHMSLNYKWIVIVTKKIFNKTLPFKTRFGYIINLLLVCFV